MFETIRKILAPAQHRRKQALDKARRQFTKCGYSLDDLTDSELEKLITYGAGGIENHTPLSAKRIYWMLRKISPDGKQLKKRKIKRAAPRL